MARIALDTTSVENDESFQSSSYQLPSFRFEGLLKKPETQKDLFFVHEAQRSSESAGDRDQAWSNSSTTDSEESKKRLLPPFPASPMGLHQRKSSLPNNSIGPLSISKHRSNESPAQRTDTTSTVRMPRRPQASGTSKELPSENRRKSIYIDSGKFSVDGPASPKTPPRTTGYLSRHTGDSLSEPLTPSSMKIPHLGFNDSESNEDHSIASLSSPPSLSHSLQLSDTGYAKTLERMRRKHNCIRELYNTEWQFAQDMAVIVRIYMCGSAGLGLSVRQIDHLFSNVPQVLDISLSVVAILESHIPSQVLHGDGTLGTLDIAADKELSVGRAMCLALSGQLYEVYESYIHRSNEQSDTYYKITSPFHRHPQQVNHRQADNLSQLSANDTKIAEWLDQCKRRANKFTTAWSLDSLLIKPVQRLGKYPLFLKTILDCTDEAHNDFEDSERAYKRSKHFLDCVNARFGLKEEEEALNLQSESGLSARNRPSRSH